MSIDRRSPPSIAAIERARHEWLLDLHQRRQPKARRQRQTLVDTPGRGYRSRILCLAPEPETFDVFEEPSEALVAELPVWSFDVGFAAEAQLSAVLALQIMWNQEDGAPELVKLYSSFSATWTTLDPQVGASSALDSRLCWPSSSLIAEEEYVSLPLVSAARLPDGPHSIEFVFYSQQENKEPNPPGAHPHQIRAHLWATIVAVEDFNPDDGPGCFDFYEDPGGGEG